MNFEVEKKSNKKKIILGLSALVIIGIVLVIDNTFAKYSNVKTIHLVNGVVNYTKGDFNIVAMYKNDGDGDIVIDRMPNSGYVINQDRSYCDVNGSKDTEAKLYTNDAGDHVIMNLQKGSKCYLYFDKNIINSKTTLAALKQTSKGKHSYIGIFTEIAKSSDTGIFETEDDYGTSYYFRGVEDKLNNWVQFAGFYWRIIRINGNGSIRMIYSGVANGNPSSANKSGTTTQIETSPYNHTYNDNAYVGYMMGIPLNGTGTSYNITSSNSTSNIEAHSNTYNSDIKKHIDNWYTINIEEKKDSNGNSYTTYLDTEVGFCNDRQIKNAAFSGYSGNGASTSQTGYAPAGRLLSSGNYKSSQTPSLKCANKDRDLFTISSSKFGNKKLTYPVGLITSDEVVYAGGFGNKNNTNYYLNTSHNYWTMSPVNYGVSEAELFKVGTSGNLDTHQIHYKLGVRPVINLKATTLTGGNGSESSPYLT